MKICLNRNQVGILIKTLFNYIRLKIEKKISVGKYSSYSNESVAYYLISSFASFKLNTWFSSRKHKALEHNFNS